MCSNLFTNSLDQKYTGSYVSNQLLVNELNVLSFMTFLNFLVRGFHFFVFSKIEDGFPVFLTVFHLLKILIVLPKILFVGTLVPMITFLKIITFSIGVFVSQKKDISSLAV